MRNSGYRSVHAGQQQMSHDIKAMLALGGLATSTTYIYLKGGPGRGDQPIPADQN